MPQPHETMKAQAFGPSQAGHHITTSISILSSQSKAMSAVQMRYQHTHSSQRLHCIVLHRSCAGESLTRALFAHADTRQAVPHRNPDAKHVRPEQHASTFRPLPARAVLHSTVPVIARPSSTPRTAVAQQNASASASTLLHPISLHTFTCPRSPWPQHKGFDR